MGDIVDKLMRAYQLTGKLKEVEVLNAWEELMGKAVAIRTTDLRIANKTLYVALNSSVMRDELMHGKQVIIERINQKAGFQMVSDVWFS